MVDTQALAVPTSNGEHALSGVPFEQDTLRLAKAMAASGFFKDSPDVAKAVVKILAGRELGFGVVASMTGIYIVDGKVTLSANLMAAAIKRSGRYNYRVRTLTAEACAIEFFEGKESIGVSDFTLEDARTAGLAGKGTWKQYPRNLLFARAMSNGARFFCADVFGGPTYTPEELGANVDQDGTPLQFAEQAELRRGVVPEETVTPDQMTVKQPSNKPAEEEPPPGTKVSDRAGEFAREFADVLGEDEPESAPETRPESSLRAECRSVLARMKVINPATKVLLPEDYADDGIWNAWLDEYAPKLEAAERRAQNATQRGR